MKDDFGSESFLPETSQQGLESNQGLIIIQYLLQRRKGGKGGEMKKYIMGQLLPKAYCNVANDKDETRYMTRN